MAEETPAAGEMGVAAAPIHRQAPLSLGRALVYSSGNFGSGIFFAFNTFVLSLYLLGLGASPVLMGLLSSTRSVEGAVIQPLVGAWSDRTWSRRLGRRRPFIVGFVPLQLYSVLFLAGVGNAAQTGSSYPLLTRLVRPDRMGLYTGLLSTVTSIAAPASALIAGLLIQRLGYAFMFPFVAAMFLLSLVPLALVDVRAGEAKVNAELRFEAQQAMAA